MNPLSKHPHLFANGMFGVSFGIEGTGRNEPIQNKITTNFKGYMSDENRIYVNGYRMPVERCTLIARPIEDMKRSELQDTSKYYTTYENDLMISQLESDIEKGELLATDQNQLLSIGVYPFDQSHFGDTVIDTRTLTNEVS